MEQTLLHYGVKGMKWGVHRTRQWTSKPKRSYMSRSMEQQNKEARLKEAYKSEKDRNKRKQLKESYKNETRKGKALLDEWGRYNTFMHKKVGNTSKLKVTENPDGTYSYTNKKGQALKKYEVDAAFDYELEKGAKRGAIFFNSIAAIGFGALAYSALRK